MNSIRLFASWLEPLTTALARLKIPWAYRWRLVIFQPIALILNSYKYISVPSSSVIRIPTRGKHTLRALTFVPQTAAAKTDAASSSNLRPLHIDFHGGVFLGGIAEYDAEFCRQLSDRTGAVVISAEYRHAPKHAFPASHDDADDAIKWILENAEPLWQAAADGQWILCWCQSDDGGRREGEGCCRVLCAGE